MKIYFAPLEGITGYLYRNAHHRCYSGIDKYYTPFLSPGPVTGLGAKMLKDILPENNPDIPLVPQILTNRAEDFIKSAEIIGDYGYREINLNLGCPSGTVVAKKKGSGFLSFPEELERFLDEIFESAPVAAGEIELSIKTRIGRYSPEEWPGLMELYNRYPMKELIIHPRIQKDLYKNHPNMEVFWSALSESKNPVVYNGDLFTAADVLEFMKKFPSVHTIMLGRGLITDPALAEKVQKLTAMTGSCLETDDKSAEILDALSGMGDMGIIPEETARLKAFLDMLCEEYSEAFSGDRNVLFKMKELWCYIITRFPDSGKYEKRIKKAQSLAEYQAAADGLLHGAGMGEMI